MKTFLLLLLITGCGKGSVSPVDCSQLGQACREASTFGPDKAATPEAHVTYIPIPEGHYLCGEGTCIMDDGSTEHLPFAAYRTNEPPPATHHPSLPTPKGDKVKRKKPHSKVRFGGNPDAAYWCDMKECMFPNMIQQQPPTAPDEYAACIQRWHPIDGRPTYDVQRENCDFFCRQFPMDNRPYDRNQLPTIPQPPAASNDSNKCIGFNGKENVALPCTPTYPPDYKMPKGESR